MGNNQGEENNVEVDDDVVTASMVRARQNTDGEYPRRILWKMPLIYGQKLAVSGQECWPSAIEVDCFIFLAFCSRKERKKKGHAILSMRTSE